MGATTKTPATSKELELLLESVRKKRKELDRKFEDDPMNYGITAEIAQLREAENRLSERIADALQREQAVNVKSMQGKLTKAYVARCKDVAQLQKTVEKLVDDVIVQSDSLREGYKDLEKIAAQLDEIPMQPPIPLWQRHGGQAVPYSYKVRAALQSL